jgi:oxygen-independent coproporphyrinogen-3 oxidase
MMPYSPLSLYVHIPFCPQHCPYCAFTVVTGHADLHTRYVEAVCTELRRWQSLAPRGPLQTIFFGGGTPSLLTPAQLQQMLATAVAIFGLAPGAEITLEANPSTADAEKFAALRAAGFNRLSLGVQALNDADLRALGRRHSAAEALAAYAAARQAGFANVNVDVIFSIPGSSRQRWQHTIRQLLTLAPEHISTYALTIEEGTRFAQREHHGRLQPVSEDDDAWAYAWVMETLSAAGYEHYEVSNFARPGYRARHNWGYWYGVDYLGVGLAAHSLLAGRRHWNRRHLRHYIATLETGQDPCAGAEVLDPVTMRHERLWLQLRTCAGATLTTPECGVLQHSPKVQAMCDAGWVQRTEARLSLTASGFLLADAIGTEIIAVLAAGISESQKALATTTIP